MRPKTMGACTKCGVYGKVRSNGLCVPHYLADWREKMRAVPCKVEGCERGCKSRMMCERHYSHYMRSRDSKKKLEDFVRAIADEEREKIISLLKKYGQHEAAKLVSISVRKEVALLDNPPVAQWIAQTVSTRKVGGSNPSGGASVLNLGNYE